MYEIEQLEIALHQVCQYLDIMNENLESLNRIGKD